MSDHTAGPWGYALCHEATPHYEIGPLDEDGRVDLIESVAVTVSGYAPALVREAEANARRIVACVNACEGLSTEALEQGVVGELLAALKEAETDLCNELDQLRQDYATDSPVYHYCQEQQQRWAAVIAKVEVER